MCKKTENKINKDNNCNKNKAQLIVWFIAGCWMYCLWKHFCK